VQTAIAVLKRVNVNEAKGGRGRLQYGIERIVAHAVICRQHARAQVPKRIRSGTNELRQRLARLISFADEYSIGTQACKGKPCVLGQHAVKSNDFFKSKFVLSCLENCPAPTFQTVTRCTFTFDLKAGTAVGKQQETGSAQQSGGRCGLPSPLPVLPALVAQTLPALVFCKLRDNSRQFQADYL